MTYHTNSPALTASKAGHVHNDVHERGTYPCGVLSLAAGGLYQPVLGDDVIEADEILSKITDPRTTNEQIVWAIIIVMTSFVPAELNQRASEIYKVMHDDWKALIRTYVNATITAPVVMGGMQ